MKPNNNDPAGDWPEDFTHENGRYCQKCVYCSKEFIGHKSRIVCKICARAIKATFNEANDERGNDENL